MWSPYEANPSRELCSPQSIRIILGSEMMDEKTVSLLKSESQLVLGDLLGKLRRTNNLKVIITMPSVVSDRPCTIEEIAMTRKGNLRQCRKMTDNA